MQGTQYHDGSFGENAVIIKGKRADRKKQEGNLSAFFHVNGELLRMKIGDFISDELELLFSKELELREKFAFFCEDRNKKIKADYFISNLDPFLFILKINLEPYDNNGEITES